MVQGSRKHSSRLAFGVKYENILRHFSKFRILLLLLQRNVTQRRKRNSTAIQSTEATPKFQTKELTRNANPKPEEYECIAIPPIVASLLHRFLQPFVSSSITSISFSTMNTSHQPTSFIAPPLPHSTSYAFLPPALSPVGPCHSFPASLSGLPPTAPYLSPGPSALYGSSLDTLLYSSVFVPARLHSPEGASCGFCTFSDDGSTRWICESAGGVVSVSESLA